MTEAALFRAGRKALGLGTPLMARALALSGGNVVRGWERGAHAVPGPAWAALYFMLAASGHSELSDQLRAGPLAGAWDNFPWPKDRRRRSARSSGTASFQPASPPSQPRANKIGTPNGSI